MEKQHQIKRTLERQESIEMVRRLLAGNTHKTRSALARAVCAHFGFFDPRGIAQSSGCVKALRELERAGHFLLPAARYKNVAADRKPRRLNAAVEEPREVPSKAGQIKGAILVKVETVDQMRLWNEMMICDHPQGAGPLVGAQVRYLISSDHGWLGGFAFAASSRQLADRERWIGWDSATRDQYLNRVLCMSRFLIRPSVKCHNLASRMLGLVVRGVAQDFETQYGYRPWLLESFVDISQFAGTCYRAANWVEIGQTKGRGRQDRHNKQDKGVKAIYMYPLESDFRLRMGVAEPTEPFKLAKPVVPPALGMMEGLDADAWAANEFGGAILGDSRLSERLVDSARLLGAMPGRAFCAVAQGDWPAIKAYYRMIDKPDDSKVSMAAILAPHHQRTVQRMKAHKTVLNIQDGTALNFSGLSRCEGLGVIGSNQTGARSGGLHLHSTFAISTDGLPLGVLAAQCTAPQPKAKDESRSAKTAPIEERKTYDWIVGLRACVKLAPDLPDTRQVCVMDREADFYELFDEQRVSGCVDLLVRAKHDRGTSGPLKLFESLRQAPAQGRLRIDVPRQSERPKKSKQKARPQRAARKADVELRYQQVEFRPPAEHKDKQPIVLWVVHVIETSPPTDTPALEWFLLTTIAITSDEQAQECLRWYCLRWRIEDWHRVLKSGCGIEGMQHKSAERLKRAIAINLVIGWRLMLMTLLGRTCPDLPSELLFSDIEIEVLAAYAKKKDSPRPPGLAVPRAS
jgi:hypothetical protein